MEAQFCLSSRCPIQKRLGVTVLRFHLNVQPFLGPLDPAVEAEHVGGVGDAEDVLEDAAPAEQDVLPFPPAERAAALSTSACSSAGVASNCAA